MFVKKITPSNKETLSFEGSTCIECGNEPAEVIVKIGSHTSQLCLKCVWDMMEMLDETTHANFVSAEKEN